MRPWVLIAALLVSPVSVTADGDHTAVVLEVDSSVHVPRSAERSFSQTIHTDENTTSATILTVGVKTNVLEGAVARQIIRQTWAEAEQTQRWGVRVWFVGCQPDLSTLSEIEYARAKEAIELEKSTYRDLLTNELRCRNSSGDLVAKTVEFMHFIESTSLQQVPQYVMMTDDDVYVRLDILVSILKSQKLPSDGVYAGSEGHREPSPPDRDPRSPLFLPFDLYPMSELPPYVDSAHYIVSRDIVEFISSNRDDLVGFRGLDDITMALWMLALQVHPVFLDSFQVLRDEPCRGSPISLAHVSLTAIQEIHANILDGTEFCSKFSYERWRRPLPEHPSTEDDQQPLPFVKFYWDLQHDPASSSLHVQVDVSVGDHRETLVYVPSAGPYADVFCRRLLEILYVKFTITKGRKFCAHHRYLLQSFLSNPANDPPSLRAKTEIVRHNLARDEFDEASNTTSPVITVALSQAAAYSRVLVECLFTSAYNDYHVVVLNEADLLPQSPPPDVFVFSILDDSGSVGSPGLSSGALFVGKYGSTSRLIMLSGEAWPVSMLDSRVTLISTVAEPKHSKHIYIPYASSTFGEMVRHNPTELLNPASSVYDTEKPRRFCAYLYANCERASREYMYDLLSTIDTVDALGICQGSLREPDESRRASRLSNFYSDDAVDMYREYKFVIAFENTATVAGYVTEKIVNAFLAGSVPIYHGHSATVRKLFNPKAFIDCGSFESLKACADEVHRLHLSQSDYQAMKLEAPITNRSAFFEVFSWHPSVTNNEGIARDSTGLDRLSTQLQANLH